MAAALWSSKSPFLGWFSTKQSCAWSSAKKSMKTRSGHVDHVRHVSSPPTEGEADHVSRQSQPRAHVSGSRGLVEKRLRSPRVIPRSLKRQTTCAILRIRHVGHTREPREPDEGRVDARGRHEPKGSKWGETRRLLDTCAMSKRGQMLVSTREPRVEALSQVGHLSLGPNFSHARMARSALPPPCGAF